MNSIGINTSHMPTQNAKVTLTQPVAVDEVDAEIVVVEGVALQLLCRAHFKVG